MSLGTIVRLAAALVATAALAGCIDVGMDINVKSPEEAVATMTTTISAQFYPMLKAQQAQSASGGGASDDDFCKKDGGTLVENADGSATCTVTKSGKFADLDFDNGDDKIGFTSPGPGLVRVAFPTKEFQTGLDKAASGANGGDSGSGNGNDAAAKAQEDQMKAMMTAYFAGHFLTIKVEGGEITDSNMTIAPDKQSAEEKVAFTDLLAGTAKLPDELYAVVKVQ